MPGEANLYMIKKGYCPPFKEILLAMWNYLRLIKMGKNNKCFTFQNLDIVW